MTSNLMKSLDFTDEDLTYNRNGALSPRQAARLKTKRRTAKIIMLLFGVLVACGGGVAFLIDAGKLFLAGDPNWVGWAIGGGFFMLFGLPLIFLGVKPSRPIQVAAAQGTARIARVERSSENVDAPPSTYVVTEMHLAGKIFSLPDDTFAELEDGAGYVVYYLEGHLQILSLEKM
jgi:hypothetical protein